MKALLLICSGLLLTGCLKAVDAGRYGALEQIPSRTIATSLPVLENAEALHDSRQRIQQLIEQGGTKVVPAELYTARMRWLRALREHSNGMNSEAAIRLQKLALQLDQLEQQLSAYRSSSSPIPAASVPL